MDLKCEKLVFPCFTLEIDKTLVYQFLVRTLLPFYLLFFCIFAGFWVGPFCLFSFFCIFAAFLVGLFCLFCILLFCIFAVFLVGPFCLFSFFCILLFCIFASFLVGPFRLFAFLYFVVLYFCQFFGRTFLPFALPCPESSASLTSVDSISSLFILFFHSRLS